MKKLARYPGLVMFIVFLAFYLSAKYIFGLTNYFFISTMSAFVGVFLAPRRKIIETQSGPKKQITWIFLKDPIIIY
jgi:hypothetical protein